MTDLAPSVDYGAVTETAGLPASKRQLAMAYHRYTMAARHCLGDLLEVGCGAGQGLRYLASVASRLVVGGDVTASNLVEAGRVYHGPLIRLDAMRLPFRSQSFDSVVLLEAVYYLPDLGQFLRECRRVLRPQGTLLISSVNPAWPDFNPSAHSVRYYSAPELGRAVSAAGFAATLYGAFPEDQPTALQRARSVAKRIAVRFHLIPSAFKHKTLLKRLMYGRLQEIPADISDVAIPFEEPAKLSGDDSSPHHVIVYAVGVAEGAAGA